MTALVQVSSSQPITIVPEASGGGSVVLTLADFFQFGLPGKLTDLLANFSPSTATFSFNSKTVTITIDSSRTDPFQANFTAVCDPTQ